MDAGTASAPGPVGLAAVWEAHRARLLEIVARRLPPVLAAVLEPDDILQAAYPDAARRWDSFCARGAEPAPGSAFVWLYGVVMARLTDEFRRHTRGAADLRRNLPWPVASSVQLGLSLVAGGRGPLSELAAADARARMGQALDQLPDTDREVLWLRHSEEFTFQEIGEHTGVTENAAAQRYVRALRKLRAVWELMEPADGSRP